ncbi:MAG: ribbon-helix-helix domain-containing protein [Candidatus Hodarchaeales archaeon]|jgi:metal-responsive CopG/Arc/MetJ family transcriptional regulator
MKIITINVQRSLVKKIDSEICDSALLYPSRSECVRVAIRKFLDKIMKTDEVDLDEIKKLENELKTWEKYNKHVKKRIVTINVPENYLIIIDKLTKQKILESRSYSIRVAIYSFIKEEMKFINEKIKSFANTQMEIPTYRTKIRQNGKTLSPIKMVENHGLEIYGNEKEVAIKEDGNIKTYQVREIKAI